MRLFLSYSHKDRDFVLKLYNTLLSSKIDVFIDDKDIKIGDNILDRIEKGLTEATGLLYVISKSSTKSKWVNDELGMARVKALSKKDMFTIYPLLIDDVELPLSIRQLKYADFKDWTVNEKYYSAVSHLLSSLRISIDKTPIGLLDFAKKNHALLLSVMHNSKTVVGVVDGCQDLFYFVSSELRAYSYFDLAYRISETIYHQGVSLDALEELSRRLAEQEDPSIEPLLQLISKSIDSFRKLWPYSGDRDIFRGIIMSFTALSKALSDMLTDLYNEATVLIEHNNLSISNNSP